MNRGAVIRVHALLYPLAPPLLPGTYDHARTLWFAGIGATGRAIGRPDIVAAPTGLALADRIDDLRDAIGARIRAALPGPIGAFAEAQITGERGHLPRAINEALQVSGLAHILSISGLHMALVAGGVFTVLRALLALSPRLAETRPIKAWAALGALLAAAVYLALSGGGIATWRSAIMIVMMFAAVLLERPALSLHNLVATAALLVIASPEAVLSASFQMSFLAVMGLIAAHEAWSGWRAERDRDGDGPGETPRARLLLRRILAMGHGHARDHAGGEHVQRAASRSTTSTAFRPMGSWPMRWPFPWSRCSSCRPCSPPWWPCPSAWNSCRFS